LGPMGRFLTSRSKMCHDMHLRMRPGCCQARQAQSQSPCRTSRRVMRGPGGRWCNSLLLTPRRTQNQLPKPEAQLFQLPKPKWQAGVDVGSL
jgi:hypothetical protein